MPFFHPLLLLLLHGQFKEFLSHGADLVGTLEDRLAALAPGELEVEEASGLAGFEDAVLLGGIFGEEFGQGDGLEFDGLQGGVVGEGRVVVRGELCGVRHCEERDRSCVELILWTKRRQIDVDAPWCKTRL